MGISLAALPLNAQNALMISASSVRTKKVAQVVSNAIKLYLFQILWMLRKPLVAKKENLLALLIYNAKTVLIQIANTVKTAETVQFVNNAKRN
ncbi:unnamed protein product [Blepharisma stoltei]|uniref:Uncharacterized protein n=1 Tax=Blepharisma stoltei TaxID=1481888 RepID=A0AAU9JK81_9CILI|nr:unnamed protein product [Blepharisma stoltei]